MTQSATMTNTDIGPAADAPAAPRSLLSGAITAGLVAGDLLR